MARTPIRLLPVACRAARTPGSTTPSTGRWYFWRSTGSDTEELVLQAATTTLTSNCSKKERICSPKAIISAGGREP